MKKIILSVCVSLALFACSNDDETGSKDDSSGISNDPLSGMLYGETFDATGGRADYQNVFGEDMVVIQLSSEGLGCETGEFSGYFPINITVPQAEGTYNQGVYVSFNDPNSSDFISVSSGMDVEILSLTADTVEFKIKVSSTTTANNLEGKYQVAICGEQGV